MKILIQLQFKFEIKAKDEHFSSCRSLSQYGAKVRESLLHEGIASLLQYLYEELLVRNSWFKLTALSFIDSETSRTLGNSSGYTGPKKRLLQSTDEEIASLQAIGKKYNEPQDEFNQALHELEKDHSQ